MPAALFRVRQTYFLSCKSAAIATGTEWYLNLNGSVASVNADRGQLFPDSRNTYFTPLTTVKVLALAGDDTVAVTASYVDVAVFGGAGYDTYIRRGSDVDDLLILDLSRVNSIEFLSVDGLSGDDEVVIITSVTIVVFIYGSEGDDSLDASGAASGVYLYGGQGADRIVGSAFNDVLLAGNGNDVLIGGYGNDVLRGDDGDDTLFGDTENDDGMALHSRDDVLEGGGTAAIFCGVDLETTNYAVTPGPTSCMVKPEKTYCMVESTSMWISSGGGADNDTFVIYLFDDRRDFLDDVDNSRSRDRRRRRGGR